MHRLCIVLFTVTTSLYATSQVNTPADKEYRHEIGVNTTFFLREVTDLSATAIDFFPYMVTYKYVAPSQWAFRSGAGIFYVDDLGQENGVTTGTQNIEANVRAGFEYQVPVGKKWRFNAGFDVMFNYTREETITNSGFDIVKLTTDDYRFGGGPVVGMIFRPARRISISMETALYYRRLQRSERQVFQSFPDFNIVDESNGNDIKFFIPGSIIVAIHF